MFPDNAAAIEDFAGLLQHGLRAYRHDDHLAALLALADLHLVQAQRRCQPGDTAMAMRSVLTRGLERLAQSDSTGADLLSRRFVQGQTAHQAARALGYSESMIWTKQRQAISNLAQIILEAEGEASQAVVWDEARQAALDSLPPPTFTRLFGVHAPLASLAAFLSDPDSHWLVALEGMGGVGKTALARRVVEDLVCQGRFQAVAWITAQQHAFVGSRLRSLDQPALTFAALLDQTACSLGLETRLDLPEREQAQRLHSALAGRPTLLVVDNLETAIDLALALQSYMMDQGKWSDWELLLRQLLEKADCIASQERRFALRHYLGAVYMRQHRPVSADLAADHAADLRCGPDGAGQPLWIGRP